MGRGLGWGLGGGGGGRVVVVVGGGYERFVPSPCSRSSLVQDSETSFMGGSGAGVGVGRWGWGWGGRV